MPTDNTPTDGDDVAVGGRTAGLSAVLERRRLLRAAGCSASLFAFAGCTGGGGSGATDGGTPTSTEAEEEEEEHEEELPEGVSAEEFEEGPVPAAYRTATSQGDEERDPNGLTPKSEARFMEASDAVEEGLAPEGRACENCADFIPDKNGDGFGACAEVAGYVGTEDWCALWESVDEHEE
jgi:hypothetical protein